jgi:eukaryotic-like serine/threonine-protein kinase
VTVTEQMPRTPREAVLLDGRFRLDQRIGGSGAISLWRATDELLRRPVAIHLLPARTPAPPGLAEAVQASARIYDTRFAPIFDASYLAEFPCIISEWAGDPNLEDLLLTGLPTPAMAALIIAEAAEALSSADEGGRPHLRLRLRSLHWGSSGLKITGLGVDAVLSGAELAVSDATVADTTALAQILYALVTGYWPGEEATALPAAPRSRAGLYEPRQLRAGVPAILNAIICHALQGQPGWGEPSILSPAALATALRSALKSWTASVVPRPATAVQSAVTCMQPQQTPSPASPVQGSPVRGNGMRGNARHARARVRIGGRPTFASCIP